MKHLKLKQRLLHRSRNLFYFEMFNITEYLVLIVSLTHRINYNYSPLNQTKCKQDKPFQADLNLSSPSEPEKHKDPRIQDPQEGLQCEEGFMDILKYHYFLINILFLIITLSALKIIKKNKIGNK